MINNEKIKAFTLIELLVVIIIIGILATISVASYGGYIERARITKASIFADKLKTLALTKEAETEETILISYYDFESGANSTNPRIIDKSESKNNLSSGYSQTVGESFNKTNALYSIHNQSLRTNKKPNINYKVTISFWMKHQEYTNSTGYPVLFWLSSGFLNRFVHQKSISFYVDSLSDKNKRIVSPNNSIKPDKWYHIVGSYDGSNMRLWIDGELIEIKENVVKNGPFSDYSDFWIGYNYEGYLDDVIIVNLAFDGEKFY